MGSNSAGDARVVSLQGRATRDVGPRKPAAEPDGPARPAQPEMSHGSVDPGIPRPIFDSPRDVDPIGHVFDGKYRIDALIGRGGMARVYRAHHTTLRRDVAIKILLPQYANKPSAAVRFEREAYSASRLKHPNCLQVTDFGTTQEGVKYLVMELLEGQDLSKQLGKSVNAQRAVELMLQILRGLAHAHENGVVHRDLKPHNVFVTQDHEGREILKLVDFGLAKLLYTDVADPTFTQHGAIFGTPMYMSPEQAVGMRDVDGRSDLYSAGIIFYYLLAGQPPFSGDQVLALLHQHVAAPLPPLPDTVPQRVRQIVYKLLAKHRDERFSSALEVLEALRPLPGHDPPPVPAADLWLPLTRGSNARSGPPVSDALSEALMRAAEDPKLLRLDGTDTMKHRVPVSAGFAPKQPPTERIGLAWSPRPPKSAQPRVHISWKAFTPLVALLLLAVLWSTRRVWGLDTSPVLPLGGIELEAATVTLLLWCAIAIVGLWSFSKATR